MTKHLVFALLFVSASLFAQDTRESFIVAHIEKEIRAGGLPALAVRADRGLDLWVEVVVTNLRAKPGFERDADLIESEWANIFHDYLTRNVSERDIGDHAPLIQWLANVYSKVELALGIEVCKALHLSDIKSLNNGFPVVFRPCTFPMDNVTIPRKYEYKNHFAKGAVYYGVLPVVIYWNLQIGCWVGTSGIGGFVCGIASSGLEWLSSTTLAPALSNSIFDGLCGSQD